MGSRTIYSDSFIEQALQKVYNRGDASVVSIAEQLSINPWTLKNWMRTRQSKQRKRLGRSTPRAALANERSAAERMQLLLDSHGLEGEALGAFCRQHGLFTEQLQQWRDAFEAGLVSSPASREELRELKQSNAALERELKRKEKALAEAAALLVLQKNHPHPAHGVHL